MIKLESVKDGETVVLSEGVVYHDLSPDEVLEALALLADQLGVAVVRCPLWNVQGHQHVPGIALRKAE